MIEKEMYQSEVNQKGPHLPNPPFFIILALGNPTGKGIGRRKMEDWGNRQGINYSFS